METLEGASYPKAHQPTSPQKIDLEKRNDRKNVFPTEWLASLTFSWVWVGLGFCEARRFQSYLWYVFLSTSYIPSQCFWCLTRAAMARFTAVLRGFPQVRVLRPLPNKPDSEKNKSCYRMEQSHGLLMERECHETETKKQKWPSFRRFWDIRSPVVQEPFQTRNATSIVARV